MQDIRNAALEFIENVEKIEVEQTSAVKTRQDIEQKILEITKEIENSRQALDIATHAIEILRAVSDEAVRKAYSFLEDSLNSALDKMFKDSPRKIHIEESVRAGQYPQLEIILTVGNGNRRKIKNDSGHGIAQIISLLSILSLIVITNGRRILVMDEVLSGLSTAKLQIVTDIMWTFTQIGFQFIVNEHGYVPRGATVYHLQSENDVSNVIESYVETEGVYYGSEDTSTEGSEVLKFESKNKGSSKVERISIDSIGRFRDKTVKKEDTSEENGKPEKLPEGGIISL